jgi:class 3 adenylate cyclase
MSRRVPKSSHGAHREADTPALTGAQIGAINRFPDDNPNPVLRVDGDGHVIYANPASAGVLAALGAAVGDALEPGLAARLDAAAHARTTFDVIADFRTWALWPVEIADLGFTNIYGRDVTAERAIARFPDQNPNPVLRLDHDGKLVYANPASRGLVDGLGLTVGTRLPAALRDQLLEPARAHDGRSVELDAGERTYRLLPVDVPEFGFVNVYGTDITAVKAQERLARENERLLLNILPGPIADRLRNGERMIADRFDDVTLLFADIVGFTALSASLSPSELVGVLNEVFTAFDALVERYGLEKVKTIGDAYMVVGGMTEPSSDHTERVAAMALELTDTVERIDRAAALGIRFRIGINCGPVVAGVIGTKKFIYDIWGDTVNLASRMESLGAPGRVHVSEAVRERLGREFDFEARGLIEVKGKGHVPTYFILGRMGAAARRQDRKASARAVSSRSARP